MRLRRDDGAVVGEDEEFSVGENEGALEVGFAPNGFSGGEIDATEEAFDFLFVNGAVEAIEMTFEENRWLDVVLKFLVRPNRLGGVFIGVEESGSLAPPGGEIQFVVDDQRVGGVLAILGGPIHLPKNLAAGLGHDVH